MAGKDRKTVNIALELIEILERIMKSEGERTGIEPSYKAASVILVKRINNAGGLKE